MGVPTLNEGSRCFVKAKFFDRKGMPQIPTSLSFKVQCETTGTVLQDWTSVTPDTVVEVQINATLNSIVSRRNTIERRTVTFLCNADPPENAFTEIQQFDLIGLQAEEA